MRVSKQGQITDEWFCSSNPKTTNVTLLLVPDGWCLIRTGNELREEQTIYAAKVTRNFMSVTEYCLCSNNTDEWVIDVFVGSEQTSLSAMMNGKQRGDVTTHSWADNEWVFLVSVIRRQWVLVIRHQYNLNWVFLCQWANKQGVTVSKQPQQVSSWASERCTSEPMTKSRDRQQVSGHTTRE